MSEKKAKEQRKKQQVKIVITAYISSTPTGMNAIVQGVPADFDYAMACAGLITKTIAGYHVQTAKNGQSPTTPPNLKEGGGS